MAFKPKTIPSGHVLDNVCACHKLPWFTIPIPTHLLHASGQAWHLNIQDLYKRTREWDHNCFVILSERPGNVTSLCQFYHVHKEH